MSETRSSIRAKMAELDELLAWFDGEDFELETALEKFEEAKKLADVIEEELMSVKHKIAVVSEKFTRDNS